MAIQKLIEGIIQKKSVLCVGLDPVVNQLPEVLKEEIKASGCTLEAAGKAILNFNKAIIDEIFDLVHVVKPQSAYYEQLGIPGIKAYEETIQYAKEKGLFVIGDIKRGDIGSTSAAYANGHIGEVDILGVKREVFSCDAITINPYLGDDSNKEFYKVANENDAMNFLLVKTSNPTSDQLQNLKAEDALVYEHVAKSIAKNLEDEILYEGYGRIGAVVGATYPEELKQIRKLIPNSYFLIPGYGAQGGTADAIVNGFDDKGLGAIVNSSRGIIFSYQKESSEMPYTHWIRQATVKANEDLNGALARAGKTNK